MINVSVVVPVYKADYDLLKKCIGSLICQTLKDIEIILVDDGSPDECGRICDEFAQAYNQIKVIHQENSGVSSARNNGVKIASGEYIGFTDADDYVESDFFERLYTVAKEQYAEMVCSGYRLLHSDNITVCNLNCSNLFYNMDSVQATTEFLIFGKIDFRVWNKLFLADIAKKLSFPLEYKIAEDELFIFSFIRESKRITYIPYAGYYYFINKNSVMSSSFSDKNLDAMKVTDIIAGQLETENFQNEKALNFFKLNTYIRLWVKIVSDKKLYAKYIYEADYLKKQIKSIRFTKVSYHGNKTLRLFFIPIKISALFTVFMLRKFRFIANKISL